MKIAIYHGFPWWHFEMLGYMYEYCSHNAIDFDIYAQISTLWKPFYDSHFGETEWRDPSTLDLEQYDYVILLTDDDTTFPEAHFTKYPHKIISIDHHADIRNGSVKTRVATRPTASLKPWAIPCYALRTIKHPLPTTLHVALIGICNLPLAEGQLEAMFSNFHDIMFHIVGYHAQELETRNIKCYRYIDASHMIGILEKCSYVLSLLKTTEYIEKALSGSIPLAYSCLCIPIIPKKAKEAIKLQTAIAIEDIQGTELPIPTSEDFANLRKERQQMIEHRNRVLTCALFS